MLCLSPRRSATCRIAGWVIAAAAAIFAFTQASLLCLAQDAVPAGYRVYALEHADPDRVGDELQAALVTPAGPPDVLIDRQLRRVLVRGDDATQKATQELVTLLDRAPPKETAAGEGAPVLQNYRVPREQLDRLAGEIRQAYPAARGVRVIADRDASRLIVRAPAELHRAIAGRLAAKGGVIEKAGGENEAAGVPARSASVKTAATEPSERRSHILRNVTWRELEERVQRLWGGTLPVKVHNNGELAIFEAPTVSGQTISVEIDRRRDQVSLAGPGSGARAWERIVQAIDRPNRQADRRAHLARYRTADPRAVQRGVMLLDQARRQAAADDASATANATATLQANRRSRRFNPVSFLFQPPANAEPAAEPTADGPAAEEGGPPAQGVQFQFQPQDQFDDQGQFGQDDQAFDQPQDDPLGLGALGAFLGPVRIEFVEELGIVIIDGAAADVARVMRLIEQIEGLVGTTTPVVEIYHLRHANSVAVATLVTSLYDQVLLARQGQVSITALGKPNALLLIGRDDSVQAVIGLIAKLDQPTPSTSTVKIYPLRNMSAVDAEARITAAFPPDDPAGLEPRVRVVGDYRSNALIVIASPSDLVEVEKVLAGIDVASNQAVDEFRIFRLKNALAADLAPVLQDAINGQLLGAGRGQSAQGGFQQQQQLQGQAQQAQIRSHALIFAQLNEMGGELKRAGIVYDVRINADTSGNALLVTAPPDAMELIAAVVEQLDQLPNAQASIKVFEIVRGDATALANMLQTLFGGGNQAGAGALQQLLGAAATAGESALVPLRFSVDTRTNSIIAAGAEADLEVVEAILLKLDLSDIRQRRVEVYRLRNAPAAEVATAINEYLNTERDIQNLVPDQLNNIQAIEREVSVVSEVVSNSLIIAATPRYFDQVLQIVEDLDRRPPMVMIQAVIAEVNLNRFMEFGIELGLQDSLLFDRSTTNAAGNLAPGFNFNNQPLGNSPSNASVATRNNVAGQALSHFTMGRTNPGLGYGGLVLSAASDSVSLLLRALQENGRAQVLSRPEIMTLDNQGAFVQVGARVPYVTDSQITVNGTINTVTLQDVGIILGVTPRVSPDGMVVMQVDVEKSELGPDATGVPISINQNGDVIRAPQILISTTQTTVSARSGQTLILGGLITKSRAQTSRRVPYLSDIPILGNLFRYDSDDGERTELLVILTPIVIFGDAEIDWLKVVESDRMSWVLDDVVELHGEVGLAPGRAAWGRPRAAVIFPADDPTASEFFNSDRNRDGRDDRFDEPGYDPNFDPSTDPRFGPSNSRGGAEEVPPSGAIPGAMSRRRQPLQMPQRGGTPTPADPPAEPPTMPPFEAQSSRRAPQMQGAASAASGPWNAPYAGPPPQGPIRQAPWVAENGYTENDGFAQPAGYEQPYGVR